MKFIYGAEELHSFVRSFVRPHSWRRTVTVSSPSQDQKGPKERRKEGKASFEGETRAHRSFRGPFSSFSSLSNVYPRFPPYFSLEKRTRDMARGYARAGRLKRIIEYRSDKAGWPSPFLSTSCTLPLARWSIKYSRVSAREEGEDEAPFSFSPSFIILVAMGFSGEMSKEARETPRLLKHVFYILSLVSKPLPSSSLFTVHRRLLLHTDSYVEHIGTGSSLGSPIFSPLIYHSRRFRSARQAVKAFVLARREGLFARSCSSFHSPLFSIPSQPLSLRGISQRNAGGRKTRSPAPGGRAARYACRRLFLLSGGEGFPRSPKATKAKGSGRGE